MPAISEIQPHYKRFYYQVEIIKSFIQNPAMLV